MAYIPPHKRHLKDAETSSPAPSAFVPPLLQRNSSPRFNPDRRKDKQSFQGGRIVYAKNSISRWCIVCSTDNDDDQIPFSVRLLPMSCELIERKSGEKPLVLACNLPQGKEVSEIVINAKAKSPWVFMSDKMRPDLFECFQTLRNEMSSEGSEEVKTSFVARFGKILFHGSPISIDTPKKISAAETALSQVKRSFYNSIPNSYMEAILDGVVPKIGFTFDEEKEYYHVKVFDKFLPEATISCKCIAVEAGRELELHKIELNPVRHLVVDVSCLDKDLDLRLMLFTKRILTELTDDEKNSLRNLIKCAVIDPDVKGGLRWPLGKELSERYNVVGAWHTKAKYFKSSSMRLKLRHADRFDFRTSTGEVTREVSLKMTEISRGLRDQTVEPSPIITDMLQDALKLIWDHFLSGHPNQERNAT